MAQTKKFKTLDLVHISLFAVLIAICAWITIPAAIPFTLQTFGVFLTVGLLGWKRGTLAVIIYILLGIVGMPVFHGFSAGIGILIGPTGGYIVGFVFMSLLMGCIIEQFGTKTPIMFLAMICGLILLYAFGTAWFMVVYTHNNGTIGLATALAWCVIPFIIPDLVKMAVAVILIKRLAPFIRS